MASSAQFSVAIPGFNISAVAVPQAFSSFMAVSWRGPDGIRGLTGPAGPAGSSQSMASDSSFAGTLTGALDGTNTQFSISRTPAVGSVVLFYINGLFQDSGDFSIAGRTITSVVAPYAGDRIAAVYFY